MPKFNIDYKKLKPDLGFPLVLSHYKIPHTSNLIQETIGCPFHNEKSPSCSINKEKGMFRCFGCNAKGNVLDFVCYMQGGDPENKKDLHEAAKYAVIQILRKNPEDYRYTQTRAGGQKRQAMPGSSKTSSLKSENKSQETEVEVAKVNEPLSFQLQNLDQEHKFLSDRDCDREAVETFGLGICEKGMMADRAVFPIHNAQGELIAYCGRWLDDNPPEGEGKYKLPKGFNKSIELFNQHRAKELLANATEEILPLLVVEGYWSAIRLHMAGIPAVATFGADISEAQAIAIAKLTSDAIVVFDGDEAGREGTKRASFDLAQHIYVRAIMLEDGMKPDKVDLDLIRNVW